VEVFSASRKTTGSTRTGKD